VRQPAAPSEAAELRPAGMGRVSRASPKAGKVAPIPVETRALDQADKSLNDLRDGKVIGRVVLKP
jgi:hypothetical protein